MVSLADVALSFDKDNVTMYHTVVVLAKMLIVDILYYISENQATFDVTKLKKKISKFRKDLLH